MTAGGTVHVAPGTYAKTITTSVNGTASARIRFISDVKWGAKLVPVAGAYTMWTARGGYTDIIGFQVDGTGNTSVRIGISLVGGNSSAQNCWVHHVAQNSGCDNMGGAGLRCDQFKGAAYNNYDFIGNVVHHVGGGCGWIQGIYHQSSGTIKNNLIYACSQAIDMGHDDHDINVVNNTLFGNSGYGIYYGGCQEAYTSTCPTSGINIYNNIIYDNGGGIQGPVRAEDTLNVLRNNCVFGNTNNYDLAPNSNLSRAGEVNVNPQFVRYLRAGGGDYHLQSTSPMINKGSTTYAPLTDLDGVTRQGAPDIGAYEYTVPSGTQALPLTAEPGSLVAQPNPFNRMLSINLNSGLNQSPSVLTIYDVRGKVVHSAENMRRTYTWYTGDLPVGIYIVRVRTTSGRMVQARCTLLK